MFLAGLAGVGDEEGLRRRVEQRLERQHIFDGDRLRSYHLILDEAALRRVVGSAEVMRAQVEHLAELIDRQRITVQVMPFEAGPYRVPSPMTIIELADGGHVVHLESVESQTTSNPRTIRECTNRFDMLRSQAASLIDSARLIDARIREFGP